MIGTRPGGLTELRRLLGVLRGPAERLQTAPSVSQARRRCWTRCAAPGWRWS